MGGERGLGEVWEELNRWETKCVCRGEVVFDMGNLFMSFVCARIFHRFPSICKERIPSSSSSSSSHWWPDWGVSAGRWRCWGGAGGAWLVAAVVVVMAIYRTGSKEMRRLPFGPPSNWKQLH